jgi:hypothetical protein
MKKALFYAAASNFAIGDVTCVSVRTNRKLPITQPTQYELTGIERDEYGDPTVEIGIPITDRPDWPVMHFCLLHADGHTGFDEAESDKQYLTPFIRNAHILVGQVPYLITLDGSDEFEGNPLSLSPSKAKVPGIITFNGNNLEKLKEYWSSKSDFSNNKEPEFWVSALLDCLKFCEFITIWSFGFDAKPVVLSHSMSTVIAQIKEEVVKSGLLISETLEHDLPEW